MFACSDSFAAGGVASPTGDSRIVIDSVVAFATTDAGVGTAGAVACAAADAGAEAEVAGDASCGVALAAQVHAQL